MAARKPKKPAKPKKPPAVKRPEGRPSKYTKDLASRICGELSGGKSLRTVCKADDVPSATTIFNWLRDIPEFLEQYTRAKEESADSMVDELLEIVDNEVYSPVMVDGMPLQIDGKPVMVKDAVSVNHARLRADTRKWIASKLKAKKYGDKVELGGPGGGPIHIEVIERVIRRP